MINIQTDMVSDKPRILRSVKLLYLIKFLEAVKR